MANKKIHFIWMHLDPLRWTEYRPLTDEYHKNIDSWRETYPDFEICVWSGPELAKLLQTNALKKHDLYNKVASMAIPVGRVDTLRLLIVYMDGGTYSDIDTRPLLDGLTIRKWTHQWKPVMPLGNNSLFFAPEKNDDMLQFVLQKIDLLQRPAIPWYIPDNNWVQTTMGSPGLQKYFRTKTVVEWMNCDDYVEHDFDAKWLGSCERFAWNYVFKPFVSCFGHCSPSGEDQSTI